MGLSRAHGRRLRRRLGLLRGGRSQGFPARPAAPLLRPAAVRRLRVLGSDGRPLLPVPPCHRQEGDDHAGPPPPSCFCPPVRLPAGPRPPPDACCCCCLHPRSPTHSCLCAAPLAHRALVSQRGAGVAGSEEPGLVESLKICFSNPHFILLSLVFGSVRRPLPPPHDGHHSHVL